MMKLKVEHVFAAAEMVTTLINQNRVMPQKGSYRLARLYAKLKPEYDLIVARRNAMIGAYNFQVPIIDGKVIEDTEENRAQPNVAMGPAVPNDKMPEFLKAWADVAAEEIEVEVQPLPLDQLDNVTAGELVILGNLVEE